MVSLRLESPFLQLPLSSNQLISFIDMLSSQEKILSNVLEQAGPLLPELLMGLAFRLLINWL